MRVVLKANTDKRSTNRNAKPPQVARERWDALLTIKSERPAGRHWADASGAASVRALGLFFYPLKFLGRGLLVAICRLFRRALREARRGAMARAPGAKCHRKATFLLGLAVSYCC